MPQMYRPTAAMQPAARASTVETPLKRDRSEKSIAASINESTIGLAAGLPEGAPLRLAVELARVVDDGNNMRVVPIVTRGITENLSDLLYLRGVDAAIVYGDTLEHFKKDPRIARIEDRVSYITHLFPAEVHVFVRPEIKSLEDLAGKAVNFNTKGTAAAHTGPILFERLGIKIDAHFEPHPKVMAELAKNDKFAAVVFVSSKPLDPFVKRKWPEGFKFLPVPLTEKLEEYYMPAQLEAADYPGLIPEGQNVRTISVPGVLAVYSWPRGSDRHRRLVRFIDYLFDRLPKLQKQAGFHAKWQDLNLAADVPGWKRFGPMQDKLNALAGVKRAAAADEGPEPSPRVKATAAETPGVRIRGRYRP
jgi:TRAP-type uncharacterized transport system substrate-binding protein